MVCLVVHSCYASASCVSFARSRRSRMFFPISRISIAPTLSLPQKWESVTQGFFYMRCTCFKKSPSRFILQIAIEAENQGAFGVVVNAPISNEVISRIKEVVDIPVIATIVSDQMDIRSRIEAGLIFSMCPARRRRRRSCAASVRSFRTFRFLQPEDRTMKRSWRPSTPVQTRSPTLRPAMENFLLRSCKNTAENYKYSV